MSEYHAIHLGLEKHHVRKLHRGKGIRITSAMIHDDDSQGGSLTWLTHAQVKKASKVLRGGSASFNLKMDQHQFAHNAQYGSGFFGDLWDGVKNVANKVVDVVKKGVSIVANTVLPLAQKFISLLPPSSPYIVMLQQAVNFAAPLAKSLDSAINAREQAEVQAQEAEVEEIAAEEDVYDAEDQLAVAATAATKQRLQASLEAARARLEARRKESTKAQEVADEKDRIVAQLEEKKIEADEAVEEAKMDAEDEALRIKAGAKPATEADFRSQLQASASRLKPVAARDQPAASERASNLFAPKR